MIIRTITEADRSAWSAMRTCLWPDTTDAHMQEIDEFYRGNSIDVSEVLIAEADGNVIGFLELNVRNFAEGSRKSKVPYVEGWFVQAEFRQKGVGQKLMAEAERWSLSKGFEELASDTEIDNHNSIRLHKKMGFEETERVVCFLKPLKQR